MRKNLWEILYYALVKYDWLTDFCPYCIPLSQFYNDYFVKHVIIPPQNACQYKLALCIYYIINACRFSVIRICNESETEYSGASLNFLFITTIFFGLSFHILLYWRQPYSGDCTSFTIIISSGPCLCHSEISRRYL